MEIKSMKKLSREIVEEEPNFITGRSESNSKITPDQLKNLTEEFSRLNINPNYIRHSSIISSKKNDKINYRDLNLKYFINYKDELNENLNDAIVR